MIFYAWHHRTYVKGTSFRSYYPELKLDKIKLNLIRLIVLCIAFHINAFFGCNIRYPPRRVYQLYPRYSLVKLFPDVLEKKTDSTIIHTS